MQIKAKFASFCELCKQPIEPGADIEWSPGTKPRHIKCPAPVEIPVSAKTERERPKFVRAMELLARPAEVPPSQARAQARDHFVRTVCSVGARPAQLVLPEGCEEVVLTVGPQARVMERALVRVGVEVFYLRYNGGELVDLAVNNVAASQEIGWRVAWSPVVQMAVEGIRIRA